MLKILYNRMNLYSKHLKLSFALANVRLKIQLSEGQQSIIKRIQKRDVFQYTSKVFLVVYKYDMCNEDYKDLIFTVVHAKKLKIRHVELILSAELGFRKIVFLKYLSKFAFFSSFFF